MWIRCLRGKRVQNVLSATNPSEIQCQGDHGGCRAKYRCCLPALAGFLSPHSMGPGADNKATTHCRFKEKPGELHPQMEKMQVFARLRASVSLRVKQNPGEPQPGP